jgi:hypothetical protein
MRPDVLYINLGYVLWAVEGPAAALEIQHRAVAEAERIGVSNTHALMETTWTLFEVGDWDTLLRVADQVLDAERAHEQYSQAEQVASAMSAQVLAWRGRLPEAVARFAGVLPRASRSVPQAMVPCLAGAIVLAHAQGDLQAAVAHAEVLEREQRNRDTLMMGVGHPDAVRACVAAGALDLAQSLVDGMKEPTPRAEHVAVSCRAILAEARGETDAALQLYREAAERWSEWPFVLEQALALTGVERCGGGAAEANELFARLGVSEPQLAARSAK